MHEITLLGWFKRGRMVFGCVANFECHALGQRGAGLRHEEMEVADGEILLVGSLRVIAFAHIENIVLHVFLDYEPRSAAKTQAMSLADGMKPESFMLPYPLPCLPLHHLTRLFAEIAPQIIVVVDFAEETDAL